MATSPSIGRVLDDQHLSNVVARIKGSTEKSSSTAVFTVRIAFNMHVDDLPDFPFTRTVPLIVTRNNPVEERGIGDSG